MSRLTWRHRSLEPRSNPDGRCDQIAGRRVSWGVASCALDLPEHQQLMALLSRHWAQGKNVQAASTCAYVIATSASQGHRRRNDEAREGRRGTKVWAFRGA